MRRLLKLHLIILILMFLSFRTMAQKYSDAQIKTSFVYNFAKNIGWPNENDFKSFKIGLFENDSLMISNFRQLAKIQKLKGEPIEVVTVRKISEIKDLQVFCVPKQRNSDVDKIFSQIRGKQILLITDQSKEQEIVMINFLRPTKDKISFEINKANIIFARLEVKPKLLLLGGTEIDVRELYKKSEEASRELRKELSDQRLELEKKKAELRKQKQEIEEQKEQIREQKNEIVAQTKEIGEQRVRLNRLQSAIGKQESVLKAKIDELETKQTEIAEKEKALLKQQELEKEQRKILDEQQAAIKEQEDRIKEQKSVLGEQDVVIKTQQNILLIFVGFFIIIAVLLFFVIRAYRKNKRITKELQKTNESLESAYAELEEKQEEIFQQKEELAAQAEELHATNSELSFVNKYITSSINYAQTIQQSILPIRAEMDEQFDNFVIYRPKDIVSGDFYWFTKYKDNGQLYTFVAVIDCTGHGVPGAFMSLIGSRLLNEIVNERKIIEPDKILERMDRGVKKALRQDKTENNDGMEICLCRLENTNKDSYHLCFAGAKRFLIYYNKQKGSIKRIKGSRRSIGGLKLRKPPKPFERIEMDVQKNDMLYLTSDGIVDQNDPRRKALGLKRLINHLKKYTDEPIETQKEKLEHLLDSHQKDEKQRDDISFIGIKL